MLGGSEGLFGLLGGSEGLFGLLGGSFGLLGLLGGSWGLFGLLGGSWGSFGMLGGFGGSFGLLGGSFGLLGGSCGSLGGSFGSLGGSWGSLGGSFGSWGSPGPSLSTGGLTVGALVGGVGGSAGVAPTDVLVTSPGVVTGTAATLDVVDKKFPTLVNAIGGSSSPKYDSEQSLHAGSILRIAAGIAICGLYPPGNTTEQ